MEEVKSKKLKEKEGLLALSPLLVFVVLYLVTSIIVQDFYKVPLTVAFLLSGIYAVGTSRSQSLDECISVYSRGAGSPKMMLMLWIFVLAGAFAKTTQDMGGVDAVVNLVLSLMPGNMLLAGLFLVSCFVSMSIGTSTGTVAALVPIAVGIAQATGASVPMMAAAVIGGSFFGDNLSFISDTTIAATQTQECRMRDKFRVNLYITVPVAVLIFFVYVFKGIGMEIPVHSQTVEWLKVLPYFVVLGLALIGVNVMAVLASGLFLTGIIGIYCGSYDIYGWMASAGSGIQGMGDIIIVTMMAGGLFEIVSENGGIGYLIDKLSNRVHSGRGAELSVALMVSLTNVCTANNTVAILTVGNIAKKIGNRFGVDYCKCASILDTFSCSVQGLLPYGMQLMMASGLTALSPVEFLPWLYYPFALGCFALLSILLRYPRKYSSRPCRKAVLSVRCR